MIDAKFLGAWKLLSWEITYADTDRVTLPFGEDAQGTIMYTADGYMSVSIARRGRDLFPEGKSIKSLPREIRADAYNSYFNYAGRYRVQGNDVIHSVQHSLNPNMVGTDQLRSYEFKGDLLILTGVDSINGTQRTHTIKWSR